MEGTSSKRDRQQLQSSSNDGSSDGDRLDAERGIGGFVEERRKEERRKEGKIEARGKKKLYPRCLTKKRPTKRGSPMRRQMM